MSTAPILGCSRSRQNRPKWESFLHDGRAKTVEEAIRLHGGEASRSRDAFAGLSEADRQAVLEFLGSL